MRNGSSGLWPIYDKLVRIAKGQLLIRIHKTDKMVIIRSRIVKELGENEKDGWT
jgi:hypothetical protein